MANTKTLNSIFGRNAVIASAPDAFWPLPSDFVGIEIEVEDYEATGETSTYPEWITHVDHSLRNGVEFVTASPVGGRNLTQAIDKFFDCQHTYDITPRTSIHIHVNASDNVNVDQFRNMLGLVYVVEPAIFRLADENRKWCGYCAPLTDIPPDRFMTILNENDNDVALVQAIKGESNSDRYFGFNMAAYNKHGTVEFRYFPCTKDKQLLINWVKLVMCIKRTAMLYPELGTMLAQMNGEDGIRNFLTVNMPEVFDQLWNHLDLLDAQSRVHDMLCTLKVSAPERTKGRLVMAAPLTANNPAMKKFLANKFPTYNQDVRPNLTTAADLIREFTRQGVSMHQAYQRTVDVLGSAAALQGLSEVQSTIFSSELQSDAPTARRVATAARRYESLIRTVDVSPPDYDPPVWWQAPDPTPDHPADDDPSASW